MKLKKNNVGQNSLSAQSMPNRPLDEMGQCGQCCGRLANLARHRGFNLRLPLSQTRSSATVDRRVSGDLILSRYHLSTVSQTWPYFTEWMLCIDLPSRAAGARPIEQLGSFRLSSLVACELIGLWVVITSLGMYTVKMARLSWHEAHVSWTRTQLRRLYGEQAHPASAPIRRTSASSFGDTASVASEGDPVH